MNLDEFNREEAFKVADDAVFAHTGEHLKDIDRIVFEGAWQNYEYQKIADEKDYHLDTIKQAGAKLWQKLSKALNDKVTKSNFREPLKRRWRSLTTTPTPDTQCRTPYLSSDSQSQGITEPELPNGQVPLNSPFYVKRPDENCWYNEILQPGALIRIKAPRQTGKTSLITRILAHAENQGYQTVYLNLTQADQASLGNLDQFLQWLCANISNKLNIEPLLDRYWKEKLYGSKQSCTIYFQTYLLKQIDSPIVLAFDEVHTVFEHSKISKEFFSLLRNWYEEAKNTDIWQRLRVVVAYSTEVSVSLNINESPFNVGLPVHLLEFSDSQVKDLVQRHGLDWTSNQVEQLGKMLGGHPYLVRMALDRIRRQDVTLEQLLDTAATEGGIYADYLRSHLMSLRENPELSAAFKKVISSAKPVQLEPMQVYKLQKMGLVQVQGNDVTLRCNLYCEYFRERLKDS